MSGTNTEPSWRPIGVAVVAIAGYGVWLLALPEFYDLQRPDPVSQSGVAIFMIGQATAGVGFLLFAQNMRKRINPGELAVIALVAAGVVARLFQLPATPILEDDYFRYLLDGAVALAGGNPYSVVPADVTAREFAGLISDGAGLEHTLGNVNHPEVRTVYPAVAQAAFALAAWVKPFSLAAWRGVALAAEFGVLILLLQLLDALGRPRLWAMLYWCNPLVIKEVANAAHFDGLLTLFVLAALLAAIKRRPMAAAVAIALAVGVKIWPILLLPAILRASADRRRQIIAASALFGLLVVAMALPVLAAPADGNSGFYAFSRYWLNNAPVLDALISMLAGLTGWTSMPSDLASLALRSVLAVVLLALSVWTARRYASDKHGLVTACWVLGIAIFLASPVKPPWYFVWVCALTALRPSAVVIGCVSLSLYYASYLGTPFETPPRLSPASWAAVLPIFAALLVESWRGRGRIDQETV